MEFESSAQLTLEEEEADDQEDFYRSSQDAKSESSGEYITNERNQLGLGMYEKTDESGSKAAEEEEEIGIARRSKRLRKQVEKDSSGKKNKYDGYNTQSYENENPLDESDNSS